MLKSLNTKTVGAVAILIMLLASVMDPAVHDAISNAIANPTPQTLIGIVTPFIAFVLAYYSKPHTISGE